MNILSGVFEGRTTGTPIGFYVENGDQRSKDYSKIKDVFRPGRLADFSFNAKFGFPRLSRRGAVPPGARPCPAWRAGPSPRNCSGRRGIAVYAYTVELGGIPVNDLDYESAQDRPYFSPDEAVVAAWEDRIKEVKSQGDHAGRRG